MTFSTELVSGQNFSPELYEEKILRRHFNLSHPATRSSALSHSHRFSIPTIVNAAVTGTYRNIYTLPLNRVRSFYAPDNQANRPRRCSRFFAGHMHAA